MGLMGYQFVLNIVFVLKIQIEGTFGNPGLFYDIGDSSGVDAFGGKQFIGGIKKRFLLFFLVFVYFSHNIRAPWLLL